MPTDLSFAEAVDFLKADNEAVLEGRATRLVWLRRHGEPESGWLLNGGFETSTAFGEAGACFVNGDFMATILLVQTVVEHLLGGMIAMYCDDDRAAYRSPYKTLLSRALNEQFLTTDEYELFDQLRQARNPHAHPRGVNDRSSLIRRAMDSGVAIDELIEADARAALTALVGLLNRPPFAMGAIQ